MADNLIQVFISDSCSKYLQYQPDTQIRQLLDDLITKLELKIGALDFCLIEITPHGQNILLDDHIVAEVVEKWPNMKIQDNLIPPYRLLLHRVYYLEDGPTDYQDDPVFRQMTFQDLSSKFLNTHFYMSDEVVCEFAVMYIQHQFGCYKPNKSNFINEKMLQHIIPKQLLKQNPYQFSEYIAEQYKSAPEMTIDEIEQRYVERAFAVLPFARMEVFQVKYAMRGTQKINSQIYIGLDRNGIHFFEPPGMNKRGFYSYQKIQFWSAGSDSFTVKTSDEDEETQHVFSTPIGAMLCSILQGYVLRILNKLATQNS